MPRKNISTILYLFVMHNGYRKLIGFLNFIKRDCFFLIFKHYPRV